MSSPPLTPTFSRHQSTEFFTSSPAARSSYSRRSSAAYSPAHSRVGSSHGANNLANELGGGFGESLADELGGWEEGEEEVEEYASDEDLAAAQRAGLERDSGIDVTSSPAAGHSKAGLLSVKMAAQRGHGRKASEYDGSEYGSESDFEEDNLVSASLEARLAAVESLARRGTGDVGGQENAIARATGQLHDLGAQAGIEAGSTRLTTAHTAISTHLTHQTRLLQQLIATLLSPLAPPLPASTTDEIMPLIDATLLELPALAPPLRAASSLHALSESTAELIETLSALADSLHMMRQSSLVATRRLRAVKEALREWRVEAAGRDEGVRYIEQGGWEQRLAGRECASVCRDVLGGFEEVCGEWRARLVEGQHAAAG